MPNRPKPEKKKRPPSSEDTRVPPIPKQTVGAVTGAAIGSIAGPTVAVIGGMIGAVIGKAAADGRRVRKAVRRATAVSKGALKRQPVKKLRPKSPQGGRRLRAKAARKTSSWGSSAARSHKRTMPPSRKSITSRQRSPSSRAKQKRRTGRTKRR
jgi:hypothetical protein